MKKSVENSGQISSTKYCHIPENIVKLNLKINISGGLKMSDHLYLLWTNADPITAEKMVMMYAINSKLNQWWSEVTIIIWGATPKLAVENPLIQEKIRQAIQVGVRVSACKACADQLGVTDKLIELGVEVKYWGEPLTELLKNEKVLSI